MEGTGYGVIDVMSQLIKSLMYQVTYVQNIVNDMSQNKMIIIVTVQICTGLETFYKEC